MPACPPTHPPAFHAPRLLPAPLPVHLPACLPADFALIMPNSSYLADLGALLPAVGAAGEAVHDAAAGRMSGGWALNLCAHTIMVCLQCGSPCTLQPAASHASPHAFPAPALLCPPCSVSVCG